MKTLSQIKAELLKKLFSTYGVRFTAIKTFDSGKFNGNGDSRSEFRNVRYQVTAPGFEIKTAHVEIDYALDKYSVEV